MEDLNNFLHKTLIEKNNKSLSLFETIEMAELYEKINPSYSLQLLLNAIDIKNDNDVLLGNYYYLIGRLIQMYNLCDCDYLKYYEEGLKYKNSDCAINIGIYYRDIGNNNSKMYEYFKLAYSYEINGRTSDNLAYYYFINNEFEKAVYYYEIAITYNEPISYYNYAILSLKMKKFEKYNKLIKKAHELHCMNATIHVLNDTEDINEKIQLFEEAIINYSDMKFLLPFIGILHHKKDYSKIVYYADKYYNTEKFIKNDTKTIKFHFGICEAYLNCDLEKGIILLIEFLKYTENENIMYDGYLKFLLNKAFTSNIIQNEKLYVILILNLNQLKTKLIMTYNLKINLFNYARTLSDVNFYLCYDFLVTTKIINGIDHSINNQKFEETICPITLEEFGTNNIYVLNCGHGFSKEIFFSNQIVCPMCKTPIYKNYIQRLLHSLIA